MQYVYPNASQLKKISKADRRFFEKNPHRSYYVRPVLPGEPVASRPFTYTAIRQIIPGERVRLFIASDKPLPACNEQAAALVWHWLASTEMPPWLLKIIDKREREGGRLQ
jgi:hypothetical protein